MRQVTIQNDKLKKLLADKTEAVIRGREISEEIEACDEEMKRIDQKIQDIEKKVDLKDLEFKAEDVTKRMQAVYDEMEVVKNEIFAKLKSQIPPELGLKYDEKKRVKDSWEIERNKQGLKIEKIKDLLIPLIQKEAKPLLQTEFEDISDARLENGEVVLDIVDYVEEYKAAKRKKLTAK